MIVPVVSEDLHQHEAGLKHARSGLPAMASHALFVDALAVDSRCDAADNRPALNLVF